MNSDSDMPNNLSEGRTGAPKITLLTSSCSAGTCPTVFTTDRNTLVIQGYTVKAHEVGVDLPEGEHLIEIPADLLLAAARDLG
ncbi:hypothetical protein [Virgisporangium aurantiacum]|uniref:Uncharacterized protein n=1 Tax=Virgisporangium aurantiacum TaxID=175570 RepID=A0A8J4DYP6_9ACTN|nr:hypothetical protein [Virgisporangium aurantiacum]GIJ54658.1 hypothetical protein Vau01_021740 [Virgisporangium aurantiacum]